MTDIDNSWDKVAATAADRTSKGSGIFLRLSDDGQSVVGAFIGAPYARELYWTGQGYEPFDPEKGHEKSSLKISVNFVLRESGEVKIFDMGPRLFGDISDLRKKYGAETWFEVRRKGAKGDMNTTYPVFFEDRFSEADRQRVCALQPHDIAAIYAPKASDFSDDDDAESAEKIDEKIDENEVKELTAQLRNLDPGDARALIANFKIGHIRDLRVMDLSAFRAELSALSSGADSAASAPF